MRATIRLASAFALVAAAVILPATGAWAHGSSIESSVPESNVAIEQIPEQIEIVFSEELQSSPAAISVLDPSGQQLVSSPATAKKGVLSAELTAPDPLIPGVYKVTYQVLFTDGASVRAKYEFTVDGPEVPSATPTAPEEGTSAPMSSEPDVAVSGGPVGDAVVVAEETTVSDATAASDSSGSSGGALLVVGGVVGVLLISGGLWYFARSRSS